MTDKTIFREVFNYFEKHAAASREGGAQACWLAAAAELGEVLERLEGSEFARDLLCAVYMELERRACPHPPAVL